MGEFVKNLVKKITNLVTLIFFYQEMLQKKEKLDGWFEWLKVLTEEILSSHTKTKKRLLYEAKGFLLKWSFYKYVRINRDLQS